MKGYLALVLHAHLPYIRHPEKEHCLEERWFFEAMTETYLPMVKIFDELIKDEVDFGITVSLSPPLITMMSDELLRRRYLIYLNNLIELAFKEVKRTRGFGFETLARMYLDKFLELKDLYLNRYDGEILQAFKRHYASGKIELITSCATHGYLPLMIKKSSIKAQVSAAVDLFARNFDDTPKGIWLPECGYAKKVDEILADFGIKFFFTDTHGLMYATPRPVNGVYAPVYTPAGVAAFARDQETSRQVWDMNYGYPGDSDYREFYRDIGFDLDQDYVAPYTGEGSVRVDTGIKYYRITGKTQKKQIYNPEAAREKAIKHAGNFMFNREKQIEHLAGLMDRPPIIVAPYDAELFGHWWYEGPHWIDCLLRKINSDQNTFKTISPSEYLQGNSQHQVAAVADSSWGHNGYNEVWLDNSNAWMYRHLNRAEEKMAESASLHQGADGLRRRALNQMARELLMAQSSDWAFIIKMGTTVEYAQERFKSHISRFNSLYRAIRNNSLDEDEIEAYEKLNHIFPDLDFAIYQSGGTESPKVSRSGRFRVLMLSWEFPPKTVGGLSRHVYDLARALSSQKQEVHVLTCSVPGTKSYELVDGVHVHRVTVRGTVEDQFMEWIKELNNAMFNYANGLLQQQHFDLIHAHDWLVADAGKKLKNTHNVPLISTIHATEFGRNNGIHNDTQRCINQIEWGLTFESWKVICCSKYMAREIAQVFQLPSDKIRIIPNGVEYTNILSDHVDPDFRGRYAAPHEKIVYFVGRLVPEKGVQVLIEAIPGILNQFSSVKFVISGVGPFQTYLQKRARELGIGHKVYFTGFADDHTRNLLFASSDVAVFPSIYEPFGIVALEAMAAQVPVIVSETGGLAEVINHGTDGLKVLPNDAVNLANEIVRLLSDEELGESLKRAAREKVDRVYNWITIASETIRVYGEVAYEAASLLEQGVG